jgi:pantoate--beta-alanine ligase
LQPNRAYFGQKDAQQLLVIRQMVNDLKFNLDIVMCPTVREKDGLAVSSRNKNLSKQGREQAICLYNALTVASDAILDGEKRADKIKDLMKDIITKYSLTKVDYISVANSHTLVELDYISDRVMISLAIQIEDVRLIDNILIKGE